MTNPERRTVNRLASFSRMFSDRYSRLSQSDVQREACLLRNELQHLRRTKSINLLIEMLRHVEARRPISSAKLDRVMINLRETYTTLTTPKGSAVGQKHFGQPSIASIFLLCQYLRSKRMPWVYGQSNGRLSYNGRFVVRGYSGHGAGRNNASMERVRDVGPIPRGRYRIGRPYRSPRTGRHAMDLKPIGHDAHGRSNFQIHGDKVTGDASTGCVVLPFSIRKRISSSRADTLIVIQ